MINISEITTHCVFTLITPTVRRPLVSVAFNSATATLPQRLVERALSLGLYAFDFGAFVIVGNKAASICVFDIEVRLVATHAVKLRWWSEVAEEGSNMGEELRI